ncbi:hypothetical protein Golob_020007, partial [Gossypium lobatum]|nr:hypothetical protein [Gossypium lobatum]
ALSPPSHRSNSEGCRSSCVSVLSYLGFPSFENDLRRQFSSLPLFPQPEGRLLRQEALRDERPKCKGNRYDQVGLLGSRNL